MTCLVEDRNTVRRAAERLGGFPTVQAVDVLAPDTGPRATWTCEAVLEGTAIPPAVLRACAETGAHLQADATGTRGEPAHTVVVVTA